jgi:nucleoside-triphosphatase THEP1
VKKLIEKFEESYSIGGVLAIGEKEKVFVNLSNSEKCPYYQEGEEVKEQIGDYLISENAIRFAEEAIESAIDYDIVIIDEFGRLEREKKGLYKAIERLVRKLKELDEVTLIMVIQNDVMNEALALLELEPEKIWEVQK